MAFVPHMNKSLAHFKENILIKSFSQRWSPLVISHRRDHVLESDCKPAGVFFINNAREMHDF